MKEFCLGSNASTASRHVGCVKNTALSHFGRFRHSMEEMIADRLLDGSIATNPVSAIEWQSLEKALRSGSRRLRAKSCQHLFMSSLTPEERLGMLFRAQIVPEVESRVAEAVKRLARHGESEKPTVFYAAPAPPFKRTSPKPSHEFRRNGWTAFWREARACVDHDCPYPSRACQKLGEKWVRVWEKVREFRASKGKP